MKNIEQQLQQALYELQQLKKENQYFKALLEKYRIPYDLKSLTNAQSLSSKARQINERIQLFKSLFKGRTDAYALRWENNYGKSGYTPACIHEWQLPICQKPNIKCGNCQHRELLPLTDQVLYNHLVGKQTIGLYPLLSNETCWFLVVDFDKNSWEKDVLAFMNTCKELNIPAHIERSRSGNGGHVWIFFNKETPAHLARKLGNVLLSRTLEKRFEVGMDSFDRLFPNQDTLPKGGFGNLIALPLQAIPRKNGNSVFIDEQFNPFPDQWEYLKSISKMQIEDINSIIHDSNQNSLSPIVVKENIRVTKLPCKLSIIEKNGLIIEKEGIPSSFIYQLLQLATFKNPEFYKAQAKRLSTYGIPKNIICSNETARFYTLPRGCKEELKNLLKQHSINHEFISQTHYGTEISVHFHGSLTVEQQEALSKLLENQIGILSATTGFGKTVVAAALIAKRKVNTLVIVHRKQLINQWKESLTHFLKLEESQIGQIGGGKTKQSGVIDIATIQSLSYKGEVKDCIKKYGQIIVDECHHISAYSFEKILKEAEAHYIHGLTATPKRRDGLEPIMLMQLGPIIYKVNAKNQAKTRPFKQLLLPRFTKFKSNTNDIQSLYTEIIQNEIRNQIIFEDVLMEIENGSVPLILTERVEHAYALEAMFKGFIKNIITLTGKLTNKEENHRLKALEELTDNEELVIIATGKYIGEGFDYVRLDTLFLVMPLSWKGTLEQYVGRIHRLHDNKTTLKVYDYVDSRNSILKAMYTKRMKVYNTLGYKVLHENETIQAKSEQIELF